MKKIFTVLILIFLFHFLFRAWVQRDSFTSRYDTKYWKDRYLNSQWVSPSGCNWDPHINPITCVWDDGWFAAHPVPNYTSQKRESIGDDGLYAYSGWEYVSGIDPTLLNPEIPPLGKYLIGFSILLFKNQNVFGLFFAVAALVSFFALNKIFFKSNFLAFIPVFLFSFEPLFYTQIHSTFLDLQYFTLLNLVFISFLKNKYIVSFIFLGLMMATKASLASFGLVTFTIIFYLFKEKKFKDIKKITLRIPVVFIAFLLTYIQFFILGKNFIDFLKVQKYVLHFYLTGAKAAYGIVFPMMFQGKWYTWWNTVDIVKEWSISWPLLFFISLFGSFIAVKERNSTVSLIVIWLGTYFLFLSLIPVWPRYLLLLLPFLYTLSALSIMKIINAHNEK